MNTDSRTVQALRTIGRDDRADAICYCPACRRLAAAIDADLAARKRVWDAGRAVDIAHALPRVLRNRGDEA